VIWGTVESAVAIMAASMPFLRILIVKAKSSIDARSLAKTPPRVPTWKEQGDEDVLVVEKNG